MASFTDTEKMRLDSLRSYEILDSAPDKSLDYLVQNLAHYMEVPICYISFIDEKRQWLKAKFGTSVIETSRTEAFCNLTIKAKLPLQVRDCLLHEEFRFHPAVTMSGGIRFYLGIPLISDLGYSVGTLCVADHRPREFGLTQIMHLQLMATMIMSVMDEKKAALLAIRKCADIETRLRISIDELSSINNGLLEQVDRVGISDDRLEKALDRSTECLKAMDSILDTIKRN